MKKANNSNQPRNFLFKHLEREGRIKEGQIQNWRKVFMGGQIIDPEIRYLVPPKVSARGVYNI